MTVRHDPEPPTGTPERSAATAFAGNRLVRQSENRKPDDGPAQLRSPQAQVLVFAGPRLVVDISDPDHPVACHRTTALAGLQAPGDVTVLLGHDEAGAPWLAVDCRLDPDALPGPFKAIDLRSLYIQRLADEATLGAIAQGAALVTWNRNHAFCGRCGHATQSVAGGYKRVCPSCAMQHFPRTDAVVIMLTVSADGERCLLGRSPHFPAGVYSCLAGFLEPGETIEAAVRRETLEESGVAVGTVRYHASQPWPFPHSLMIGCYGVATEETITLDDELEDCRWFDRAAVRQIIDGTHPDGVIMPPKGAITACLMADWLKGEFRP